MLAQHLPLVVLELAARLRDGRGRGQRGYQKVVTITWKYAAGDEMVAGFQRRLRRAAAGAEGADAAVPQRRVPAAARRDRGRSKPDTVFAFFAGGRRGEVRQKVTRPPTLNKNIPLYGGGFLTDGTLEAQDAAQTCSPALHYADGLTVPEATDVPAPPTRPSTRWRRTCTPCGATTPPGQLLAVGLAAGEGDLTKKGDLYKGDGCKAKIDSPRGAFTLGKNHDPVQDIYLRKVEAKENKVVGVAVKALADPGRGCTMWLLCGLGEGGGSRLEQPSPQPSPASGRGSPRKRVPPGPTAPWTSPPSSSSALNALQYGLLLFLVASGLTLIFGIMGVIPASPTAARTIGAYTGLLRWRRLVGGNFAVFATLALGLASAGLRWASCSSDFFISYLSATTCRQVLMTYGLILVFRGAAPASWSATTMHSVAPPIAAGRLPLGGLMTYPVYRLPSRRSPGVCCRGGDVVVIAPHAGHDHPRRRRRWQSRDGCGRSASTSVLFAWCSREAWRSRCWPAWSRADLVGCAGHGRAGAHHLLRGGGDRRHRLIAARSSWRCWSAWSTRSRQSAVPPGRGHRRVSADGGHPAGSRKACSGRADAMMPRSRILVPALVLLALPRACRSRCRLLTSSSPPEIAGSSRSSRCRSRAAGRRHGPREPRGIARSRHRPTRRCCCRRALIPASVFCCCRRRSPARRSTRSWSARVVMRTRGARASS